MPSASLPMHGNNTNPHIHRNGTQRKPSMTNSSNHAASQADAVAALVSLPNTPHDDNDSEYDDHDLMVMDHMGSHGGIGSRAESASERKKRRRNRQTLSCTECKRRKIKCDRKIPCESCIKRDEAHNCHWEDPKKDLPAQPFALTSDVDSLKVRIAHIEEVIRGLSQRFDIVSMDSLRNNGQADSMRMSCSTGAKNTLATPAWKTATSNCVGAGGRGSSSGVSNSQDSMTINKDDTLDSDTEDAALVLEELATRGPGFECKVEDFGNKHNGPSRRIRFLETTKDYERLPETQTTILNTYEAPPEIHGIRAISYLPSKLDPIHFKGYYLDLVDHFIPKRSVADHLIKMHMKSAEFTFGPLFRPIFLKEVEAFWELYDQRRTREVDPTWIALFLMACTLGLVHSSTHECKFDHDWSENDLKEMPQALYEVAMIAIKQSETIKRPLFRVVQASTLFLSYLQATGFFYTPEWFTWLSVGSKSAQLLGLHVLGSDPSNMPRDDPALPPGVNGVKREVAKRVWWQLVFSDYMQSVVFGNCNYVTTQHITTNEVLNIDDDELSLTEINSTSKPEYVTTSTSFLRYGVRMAKLQKTLLSLQRNKTLSYEKLLDLDKQLRDVAHQILTSIDTLEARTNVDPKQAQIKRCVVTSGIHTRLASFHRPYMLRGYKDPRYSTSTSVCVSSAKTVLIAQKQLQSIGHSCFWYACMHILTATLILFIDLFHDIDKGSLETEITEKEDALRSSLDLFDQATKSLPVTGEFAEMGKKIVMGLFDALGRRRAAASTARTTRQVNKYLNGVDSPIKHEPIGSVLKKVATSVSHEGNPNGASPSQPNSNYITTNSPQSLSQNNRSLSQSPITINTSGSNSHGKRTSSGSMSNVGHLNYNSRTDSTYSSSGHDNSPSTVLENFDFGLDDETHKLLKSFGLFKTNTADNKDAADGNTSPQDVSNPPPVQVISGFEPFLNGSQPIYPNQMAIDQTIPSSLQIPGALQVPSNGIVPNNSNGITLLPTTSENIFGNNFSAFMGIPDSATRVPAPSIWSNEVWH